MAAIIHRPEHQQHYYDPIDALPKDARELVRSHPEVNEPNEQQWNGRLISWGSLLILLCALLAAIFAIYQPVAM